MTHTINLSKILAARPYVYGAAPYNESGTTYADGSTSGNGGELKMGTPPNGVNKVNVDLLDNFAERNANYATLRNENRISNFSGYTNRVEGYYGCASAMRMILTYAYFFKYMLDNNLTDAKSISADQTFNTYLFGPDATEEKPQHPEPFFADDFSWVAPWADKYGSDDSVGTDNASGKAPNVYTQSTHLEGGVSEGYPALLTVFAEKGYEDINPSVQAFYTQKYYFKFGKTRAHTGIKLPAIDFKNANAVDATISFDWSAHMTGAGNVDKVQIVVEIVGDGVCADSEAKISLPIS